MLIFHCRYGCRYKTKFKSVVISDATLRKTWKTKHYESVFWQMGSVLWKGPYMSKYRNGCTFSALLYYTIFKSLLISWFTYQKTVVHIWYYQISLNEGIECFISAADITNTCKPLFDIPADSTGTKANTQKPAFVNCECMLSFRTVTSTSSPTLILINYCSLSWTCIRVISGMLCFTYASFFFEGYLLAAIDTWIVLQIGVKVKKR